MSIIQHLSADLNDTITAQREVADAAMVGRSVEAGASDDRRIRDHLAELSEAAIRRQLALETCMSYATPQSSDDAVAILALAAS